MGIHIDAATAEERARNSDDIVWPRTKLGLTRCRTRRELDLYLTSHAADARHDDGPSLRAGLASRLRF